MADTFHLIGLDKRGAIVPQLKAAGFRAIPLPAKSP
jgi:hypothetical protein